jgi:ABC-type sugar transport system ATPase subunit
VIAINSASNGGVSAQVTLVEHLGHEIQVVCAVGSDHRVVVRLPAGHAIPENGSLVHLDAAREHRHRFDAISGFRVD